MRKRNAAGDMERLLGTGKVEGKDWGRGCGEPEKPEKSISCSKLPNDSFNQHKSNEIPLHRICIHLHKHAEICKKNIGIIRDWNSVAICR